MDLPLYLEAQEAWEEAVAIDATADTEETLRALDRTLTLLCDRLGDLECSLVPPAVRRWSGRSSMKLLKRGRTLLAKLTQVIEKERMLRMEARFARTEERVARILDSMQPD